MSGLSGVYSVIATPFDDLGNVDEVSLRRLVRATRAAGVSGLTALGVASEAAKLSEIEKSSIVSAVIEEADQVVPVVVGVSAEATRAAVSAAVSAERAGATAVMLAPPTFLGAGPGLTAHFAAVAASIGLPLVLQDFPPATGVTLSPQQMAQVACDVPQIKTIKVEGLPSPYRISKLLPLLPQGVSVIGGTGGMYLLDELRHGARGTMTGFAYPEALVEITEAWSATQTDQAARTYYRYLPLLVLEAQPVVGLAVRKELLRLRGIISRAGVREPSLGLDEALRRDIGSTLKAVGLQFTAAN